jgi:hypothetical protein
VIRAHVVCLVLVGLALLGACESGRGTAQDPASPRAVGGAPFARSTPPSRPMTRLERPIAAQLAKEVASQGLTLSYLECPPWTEIQNRSMRCRGYLDGVTASVRVRFNRGADGGVGFHAVLLDGVIATTGLVEELMRDGYTAVDCGRVPAYPATIGRRLVCKARKGGVERYVVATVTDREGHVKIRLD